MHQIFIAPYTVTIGDINYGRHLGNDRPLVIFQDARIRFLRNIGCSEADIGEGKGLVVVEAGCRYWREVFLHEELTVQVVVAGLEGKKCTFEYTVLRASDGQKVITGFTVVLALDHSSRKVTKLPESFVCACQPYTLDRDEQPVP